jgi:hypothetical protein
MQDIYLSFQDEKEALSILYTYVSMEYEIESYFKPNYQNISIIGTVYQRPPEPTLEDYVPIPYPAPNFGVNIRLLDDEDIEPLKPYIIEPKHPIRVWA